MTNKVAAFGLDGFSIKLNCSIVAASNLKKNLNSKYLELLKSKIEFDHFLSILPCGV